MIVAALVGLLMLAPQAYMPNKPRPASTAEFIALCDNDLKACADGVFDLASERSEGEEKVAYCLPDTADGAEITANVLAWLKAHPEFGNQDSGDAIYRALVATQPCR